MKKLMILLFLFAGAGLLAQENTAQKELLKRANENYKLLNKDSEKAFKEAKQIEKEARKIGAKEAELLAIREKCAYYKRKNDFENLMLTGNSLFLKAKSYEMPIYQVVAKDILFQTYAFSGLPDKAFQELERGRKIMSRIKDNDDFTIMVRGSLFIGYSNYYMLKDDYQNRLKYLRQAGREYEKVQSKKEKARLLYVHYSNLAGYYKDINELDTAKYYAEISQSININNVRSEVQFMNLWVLGEAEMKRNNYEEALQHFQKAERLDGYKNHINIGKLYEDIITVFRRLQQEDSVKSYKIKKDALKLNVFENQNKSLHKLLKDKDNSDSKRYIFIFILIVIGVFVIYIIRKNKILREQEKTSRLYLEKISKNPNGADYSKLIEMLEKNEPGFMAYFNEIFPDFSSKLEVINPKISVSDLEFCALLRLKIPTKDIAKYKFIAPQTVRNKKHLIRKKIKIPRDIDIYQWFDDL